MGGRGGRGGGGGGKKSLSFNVEALGLMPGEPLPGPCLQPPPAYPLLEHHPPPFVLTPTSLVQLTHKIHLITHLSQQIKNLNYAWEYFPYELRPGVRKRKLPAPSDRLKPAGDRPQKGTVTDIDQLLAQLEKKETTQVKVEVDEGGEGEGKAKEGEEGEDEEEIDETDEEMDDGTDYNQNYFDNGEGYLDEDEDLDDGPIY